MKILSTILIGMLALSGSAFSAPIDSFPYYTDFEGVPDNVVLDDYGDGWNSDGTVVGEVRGGAYTRSGDYAIRITASSGGDLVSPLFDFDGLEDISVEWYFRGTATSAGTVTLYYQIDGGSWVEIYDHPFPSGSEYEHFEVEEIVDLEGESNVRFRWNIDRDGGVNNLDDITIDSFDPDPPPTPTPTVTPPTPTPTVTPPTPTPTPSPTITPTPTPRSMAPPRPGIRYGDLHPRTDSTYDIGHPQLRWTELHVEQILGASRDIEATIPAASFIHGSAEYDGIFWRFPSEGTPSSYSVMLQMPYDFDLNIDKVEFCLAWMSSNPSSALTVDWTVSLYGSDPGEPNEILRQTSFTDYNTGQETINRTPWMELEGDGEIGDKSIYFGLWRDGGSLEDDALLRYLQIRIPTISQ